MRSLTLVQAASISVIGFSILTAPPAATAAPVMFGCYFCEPFIECPSDDWIKGYCYAHNCTTNYPGCSGGPTPSCPDGLILGCNS